MPGPPPPGLQQWMIEGYLDDSERVVRVPLHKSPFRIGRASGNELRLTLDQVSGQHAELTWDGERLHLRDLNSTNGTFVNRHRITDDVALSDGDVLHFASAELRILYAPELLFDRPTVTLSFDQAQLPQRYFPNAQAFREMLAHRALTVRYQPIVRLDVPGLPVAAWEALGRADHPGVPQSIGELFRMAASLSAAAELSAVLREVAVAQSTGLPSPSPMLFVNTHPDEAITPDLLASLDRLRARAPALRLVLEIHERAITDLPRMRQLAASLAERGVGLAYDDFGAGQARLLELVEAPPDVLKFDRSLVAGLPQAPGARRQLVQSLVTMTRDLGIQALAEGVETADEAALCADLGFHLGQGWYYGHPA